jgi:hypothetical protein
MVDLRDDLVERRRCSRAGEIKPGYLADEAAPAVATNEVGAANTASACRRCPVHIDAVHLLDEVSDVTLAAYLYPERARTIGQHGFEAMLTHCAGTPFRLVLRALSDKQASEMATEFRRSTTQVRSGRGSELLHQLEAARLFGGDGRGQSATL